MPDTSSPWPAPDDLALALDAGGVIVDDVPREPEKVVSRADRIFVGLATTCAMFGLLVVGLTFVFLLWQSRIALRKVGVVTFLTKSVWNGAQQNFGVGGLILATFLIALTSLTLAVPTALAMALFINEYAPRRLRTVLTSVIDLLAALPSLIYGIWGFIALTPHLSPIGVWLTTHLSAIPLFRMSSQDASLTSSTFTAGAVVGIMVVPIITSVSRDVMAQVPRELCEGALALGSTRWGMIREVILPFGRSGIVGATLLGFGRALGETIAVVLMIAFTVRVNWRILEQGAGSIAALIVTKFGEAGEVEQSALIAAGLALFTITFIVNLVSRRIVARTAKDWSVR